MTASQGRASGTELSWRVLGLANLFRLLTIGTLASVYFTTRPNSQFGAVRPELFLMALAAYGALAVLFALAGRRLWPNRQTLVVAHGVVDSAAIAVLAFASGGVESNLAVLLVVPVGALGLLSGNRIAFLLAAIATIALLLQQSLLLTHGRGGAGELLDAGVMGAVLFLLASAVSLASSRLRESEELVQKRELDFANLAQLSQYVVQHLRESILVVDGDEHIRLINDSAARLLGLARTAPGAYLGDVSPRLLFLLTQWRARAGASPTPEATGIVPPEPQLTMSSHDGGQLMQPHFAALGESQPAPVIVFLEDTGAIAARVQQSKLAALGRLSASIAHEIRNPVGAMSHAAQLLAESKHIASEDARLTDIIRENAQRVSNIIESILRLSRREAPRPEQVNLPEWCRRFQKEYRMTSMLPANAIHAPPEDAGRVLVRVDLGQLQRIVWNLCENALRHAGAAGPVELRCGRLPGSSRPWLEVVDRGPGIAAEDVERIFEPFFTRGPQGIGLGLFLARELAEVNGATLLYEARPGGGSIFRIVFADPQRWPAEMSAT